MGCICEAHYYVSEGWLVRELRIFQAGILASESRTRVYAVNEDAPYAPAIAAPLVPA